MQIDELIVKYLNGETTAANEREHLAYWRQQSPANETLFQQLTSHSSLKEEMKLMEQFDSRIAWNAYQSRLKKVDHSTKTIHYKWLAAAVVLGVILMGGYIWTIRQVRHTTPSAKMAQVIPGKTGAILTLANGAQVSLDTIQNGIVALQGGVQARMINGKIVYEGSSDSLIYNTISTPKGRQMAIGLPDGTMVWLNAASSIRFPASFISSQRNVTVTGEIYFEVAKNSQMPFIVTIMNGAQVKVLGTHFNINAYANEAETKTTLLEGSIVVGWPGSNFSPVKPGQQAVFTSNEGVKDLHGITIKNLPQQDVLNSIAWKNGYFNFEHATLPEIMRQLERWYDIEVVYENGIPEAELTGNMTRDVSLKELMEGLDRLGISSRLEGRKLIILKHRP